MEEIWRDDGMGSWRRKGWSKADQKLISVFENTIFHKQSNYAALLPSSLSDKFTNQELAKALKLNRRIAQNMTYCLNKMGVLDKVGKEGRAILYTRTA
jgi:hypothetical protein